MIVPALLAIETLGFGDVEHRVAVRAQLDALILARQEAAAPQPIGERLAAVPVIMTTNAGRSWFSLPRP